MKLFLGAVGFFTALSFQGADLHMIGDSTMCRYKPDKAPLAGWGMFVESSAKVKVFNRAVGGRSTKSFRELGAWDYTLKNARKGDVLLIQFGHNDVAKTNIKYYAAPELFAANLERFIAEARSAGLFPVLATPVAPRKFNRQGVPVSYLHPYAEATVKVGQKCSVPVIDMHHFALEYLRAAGPEKSQEWYMYVEPGTFPAYPRGRRDDVHLNAKGAKACAGYFVRQCRESAVPQLSALFK